MGGGQVQKRAVTKQVKKGVKGESCALVQKG